MLLLDMMRNKKREENERKKVRPGIRDKRLSINPNYETLAKNGKYTKELVRRNSFRRRESERWRWSRKRRRKLNEGFRYYTPGAPDFNCSYKHQGIQSKVLKHTKKRLNTNMKK